MKGGVHTVWDIIAGLYPALYRGRFGLVSLLRGIEQSTETFFAHHF